MSFFSFSEIFEKELELYFDSNGESRRDIIRQIRIPKIQRPYAQGRSDETSERIRSALLKDLFTALSTSQELELNFVYGNIVNTDKGYVLELLDGQQRLTTLFLLHWYICARERVEGEARDRIIRALRNFVYETRATSTAFCKILSEFHPNLDNGGMPSQFITNCLWYHHAFECDSSVNGMLVMLDAIHQQYNKTNAERNAPLYKNLDKLRFYIASIGEFALKEDLYIKMNARGLQLSAFEIFKADYTKLLKKIKGAPRGFMVHIDTKWVDIFWSKEHHDDFDSAYFKFISRFLAIQYVANKENGGDWSEDERLKMLYTITNQESGGGIYSGFEHYEDLLTDHTPFLAFVFDAFYEPTIRAVLEKEFIPAWEKEGDVSKVQAPLDKALRGDMSLQQFVRFAALIFFLRDMWKKKSEKTRLEDSLHRWMRIVHNIVQNTDMTDIDVAGRLIYKLSDFSKALDLQNAEGIYANFAVLQDDRAGAVREEQEKAEAIATDSEWEKILEKAEAHPFMKGDVHFLFTSGMAPHVFQKRYKLAQEMFDENGITEPYSGHDHLLIRAVMCNLREWSNLRNLVITERVSPDLKKTLKGEAAKKLIGKVTDASSQEEALNLLRVHIDSAQKQEFDSYGFLGTQEKGNCHFYLALEHLRTNIWLYDYIKELKPRLEKQVRIYDFGGRGFVISRRNGQQRIYLNTIRGKIAQMLKADGFLFCDSDQERRINESTICFGDEIRMRINFSTSIALELIIRSDHGISIEVSGCSKDANLNTHAAWDEDRKLYLFDITVNLRFDSIENISKDIESRYAELKKQITNIEYALQQVNPHHEVVI